MRDSTNPRCSGPMAYLSASSRLNWMGMAIKAKPRTPTPVDRK